VTLESVLEESVAAPAGAHRRPAHEKRGDGR
jgi:hypothetical protein